MVTSGLTSAGAQWRSRRGSEICSWPKLEEKRIGLATAWSRTDNSPPMHA